MVQAFPVLQQEEPAALSPSTEVRGRYEPNDQVSVSRICWGFDGVSAGWQLMGWAYHSAEQKVEISLFEGDTYLLTIAADIFRQDLLEAGIGSGSHGFAIQIPHALFDGGAHKLTLCWGKGKRRAELKLVDVVLPARVSPASSRYSQIDVGEILGGVLQASASLSDLDNRSRVELQRISVDLSVRYGFSVALELLYVFALHRTIDPDGLTTRLRRLHNGESLERIVDEIVDSDECHKAWQVGGIRLLPPLDFLRAWANLGLTGNHAV